MGDVCPFLIKDAFIYGVFESSTGRAVYWPKIETLLHYLRTGISKGHGFNHDENFVTVVSVEQVLLCKAKALDIPRFYKSNYSWAFVEKHELPAGSVKT